MPSDKLTELGIKKSKSGKKEKKLYDGQGPEIGRTSQINIFRINTLFNFP